MKIRKLNKFALSLFMFGVIISGTVAPTVASAATENEAASNEAKTAATLVTKVSNNVKTPATEPNKDITTQVPVVPAEISDVVGHYVDENGVAIADNVEKEGEIGSVWILTAKDISGYHLKKIIREDDTILLNKKTVRGTYRYWGSEDKPTVTFVYAKGAETPVQKGELDVSYVDEDGNALSPADHKSGKLGDTWITGAKDIKGYHFEKVLRSANTVSMADKLVRGTYGEDPESVTFIYAKDATDNNNNGEDGNKDTNNDTNKDVNDGKTSNNDKKQNNNKATNGKKNNKKKSPKTGDSLVLAGLSGLAAISGLGFLKKSKED